MTCPPINPDDLGNPQWEANLKERTNALWMMIGVIYTVGVVGGFILFAAIAIDRLTQ